MFANRPDTGARWPPLAYAMLLFGTLLLFQPAQVYGGNSTFFSMPYGQLLLVLFPLWLALSIVATVPAWYGPAGLRRRWPLLLAALAAMAWVSGSLLYRGQGLLDGRALAGGGASAGLWLPTLIAVGVGCLAVVAAARWPRLLGQFLLLLVVLSFVPVAQVVWRDNTPWQRTPDFEHFARFSSEGNVLVVLLDTFQSDFLDEVLAAEPSLRSRFDGFAFHASASGVAPTTYLSLPTIHSGQIYRPGTSLRAFYDGSVVDGSFMNQLSARGYRAELVNPVMNKCPRAARCYPDDLLVNGLLESNLSSLALMIDLALLRSVPAALRSSVFGGGEFVFGRLIDASGTPPRSNEVLRKLTARASVGGGPTAKFVHLFSSHPPASIAADCSVGTPQEWTRPRVLAQNRCALRLVGELLDRLRALGVYENSAIVLLADHGAGLPLPPHNQRQANAAPLLMVKAPGATGPLRTDSSALSLTDVPTVICRLIDQCEGVPARGQPVFSQYDWQHRFWYLESLPIASRHRVSGSPWDPLAWRLISEDMTPTAQLDFAQERDAHRFGPGWWTPERTADGRSFRWVHGRSAVVDLVAPPQWGGVIELSGFTHPGNPSQSLEVLVDGRPVWQGAFRPKLSIEVSPTERPQGAFSLGLRFTQDAAPSPGDARRLAAAFDQLSLR